MSQEYYPWQANTLGAPISDYLVEASSNNIQGTSVLVLNGSNQSVGTSYETLWEEGGIYVFPTSASAMTVSSDDSADTAAGTGARTVLVQGLDSNYLEIQETITLNGTSGVTTTLEFFRINRVLVTSAGTGRKNAGAIFIGTGSISAGKPANVYGEIFTGDSVSHEGIYTVPANKSFHPYMLEIGVQSTKDLQLQIVRGLPSGVDIVTTEWEVSRNLTIDVRGLIDIEAKEDLTFQAKVSSGSSDVKVFIGGVLRNET